MVPQTTTTGPAGSPDGLVDRRALRLPLGRPERLTRALHVADDPGSTSGGVTGEQLTGPWSLDADARPTGLSTAVLVDKILAMAVYHQEQTPGWVVTTELQLNFPTTLPAPGATLQAEAAPLSGDEDGGSARATLRGTGGEVCVEAVGWFHGSRPAQSGTLGAYLERAAWPLGPETEASLDRLVGMEVPQSLADSTGRPAVDEGFRPGPGFAEREELLNPGGAVHGGILTSMAGLAAQQAMPDRRDYDLQSLKVLFVRPARGAIASRFAVRHAGRALRVVEVQLYAAGTEAESGVRPFIQASAVFRPARG